MTWDRPPNLNNQSLNLTQLHNTDKMFIRDIVKFDMR